MSYKSILAASLFLLSACGGGSSSGGGGGNTTVTPDFTKLTATCFQASSSNPLLQNGSLFTGSNWNDPSVLKIGSQYVMYASADTSFSGDIKIYRLVSTDGVTWSLSPSSAVLSKGSGGADWDRKSVETPSVVLFNGTYHMFYTGYPTTHTDSTSYKIGHATSSDGITWTKAATYMLAPTDPSGAPNLDFNQYVVGEPGAVVFNNKIYLYFTALGANTGVGTTLQVIGLTTSTDGTTWTTPQSVLEPDQAIYPRATWVGYSTPHPIVLNGVMHLFFDVAQASPWKQLRLHHASSYDGKTSWSQDSSANFSNTSFTWTSNEIRAPAALLDGTSLYLWFGGDDGANLGIGRATCAL